MIRQKHEQQMKKDESEKFIKTFAQGRNIIDKKIKEGLKIKVKRIEL